MTATTPSPAPADAVRASSAEQVVAWTTLTVPIGAWTIHIVALASIAHYACLHPRVHWVMHALTVALGLVCVVCGAVAWTIARRASAVAGDDEEAGNEPASIRFLAYVALAVAAVNLLLIGAEGLYVPFLDACQKGQ